MQTFVWVLVAVSTLHGNLVKDHVAVFAKSDTCYQALKSMEYFSSDQHYFCQQEILK